MALLNVIRRCHFAKETRSVKWGAHRIVGHHIRRYLRAGVVDPYFKVPKTGSALSEINTSSGLHDRFESYGVRAHSVINQMSGAPAR